MEAAIEYMDVQYEVVLSEPPFDLSRRDAEVLENSYNKLKPEHLASPSDMQVVGGTSSSEEKVRMVMFGTLAALEITIDRILLEFGQLKSSRDLNTCKSCALSSERAIWGIYPELQMNRTVFNFKDLQELFKIFLEKLVFMPLIGIGRQTEWSGHDAWIQFVEKQHA